MNILFPCQYIEFKTTENKEIKQTLSVIADIVGLKIFTGPKIDL